MTKIYNRPLDKGKRRSLRRAMTPAESRIWSRLRNNQIAGCRFRRQFGVGSYVLDFYCPRLKLAIEIDGDTHAGPTAEQYDQMRQTYIESLGVRFLRFSNTEVHNQLEIVANVILDVVVDLQKRIVEP